MKEIVVKLLSRAGNSRGVVIPHKWLVKNGNPSEVVLEITADEIVISTISQYEARK